MKIGPNLQAALDNTTGDFLRCVWMLAGVVDYKLCDRGYDCERCPFDSALGEAGSAPIVGGRDKHSIFGEWPLPTMEARARDLPDIQGYRWVGSLFYHPKHVWARIEEGGKVRMGLDDFAQKLVGRIYAVRLAQPGAEVSEGSGCWEVVHRIGEISLLAPVAGIVEEINGRLLQLPSLVNHDPYGQGWAMVIQPKSLVAALKRLYYGQKSECWFAEEIEALRRELRAVTELLPDVGATLQDGGRLVEDLTSAGDVTRLRRVINRFLSVSSSDQLDSGKGLD